MKEGPAWPSLQVGKGHKLVCDPAIHLRKLNLLACQNLLSATITKWLLVHLLVTAPTSEEELRSLCHNERFCLL